MYPPGIPRGEIPGEPAGDRPWNDYKGQNDYKDPWSRNHAPNPLPGPPRPLVRRLPPQPSVLKPAVADSQRGLAATPCHGTARREVPPNKIIHRLSGNPLALWLVMNQDLARDTQHLQTNLIVGRSKIIFTNHFLLSESIFCSAFDGGVTGPPWGLSRRSGG